MATTKHGASIAELEKKAEARDPDALCDLGLAYDDGDGVPQNLHTVYKLYLKAPKLGNVVAQYNVGVCYEYGEGVEQSYEKAVKWYLPAAHKGMGEAQCNLGVCYELGRGIEQSHEKAAK